MKAETNLYGALRRATSLACVVFCLAPAGAAAQQTYYPARAVWERHSPAEAGFDAGKLQAAIDYAKTSADPQLTDSASIANARPNEAPYNVVIGPWLAQRGPEGGMVIRGGYIVAAWGEPKKIDMTFSVTKSFLSTVAGIAFDAGLIRNVFDTVARVTQIPEFTSDPHNARITWHQLLNQTSEWQGTLWDKPDWADRFNPQQGRRPVLEPGTQWTYNDTRVNVLALALLNVWRRPLPQVLKEKIMDPIGASSTWRWWGYQNSWVDLDGLRIQSVSGGGHWGGGMQINAEDMARFGLLMLRKGKWQDRQLISERWIAMATSPTNVRPNYGYLWWLNTNGVVKTASKQAFSAQGQGGNYIFVDPGKDLVVVLRWTRDYAGVIDRIIQAMTNSP